MTFGTLLPAAFRLESWQIIAETTAVIYRAFAQIEEAQIYDNLAPGSADDPWEMGTAQMLA